MMIDGQPLFDRSRSCLIVIDVQQYFLDKLPLDQRAPLVARMAWLMRVASALQIPIMATAEDIADNGGLVEGIVTALPEGQKVFDKLVFGLCGQAAIADATGSLPPHHEAGLTRMARAGITITNVKGIYYEWLRDLASLRLVDSRRCPLPSGITL